ncbi:MAG: pyridoxamine 5'-phosphate oxidase family protein [Candidatus Binatia bacterium]
MTATGTELETQALAYMQSHNTMTLATCGGDIPWAATVFYVNDGFSLYFFSAPESRHCQNLALNPRVAVTIQEDYHDWKKIKGIQLEGTAREIGSVTEKAKAMAYYGSKYPDVIRVFTDPGSGPFYKAFLKVRFYCVIPQRVFYIDNEQGFGKRQELVVKEDA